MSEFKFGQNHGLMLSRRVGDSIFIFVRGEIIEIRVTRLTASVVKLLCVADKEKVSIRRGEYLKEAEQDFDTAP